MRRFWFGLVCALSVSVQLWADDIVVNLENQRVSTYLNEVEYTPEMASVVTNYYTADMGRQDWPVPAVVSVPQHDAEEVTVVCVNMNDRSEIHVRTFTGHDSEVSIYNLIPQRTYYYLVSSDGKSLADGFITTEGQVRMIYVPSIMNVRDLGGWQTTDGKRIKYGKIYRGGELNGQYVATEEDIRTLRDLGIEAEIDMRYLGENDGAGTSAFGFLGLEDMDDDDDDLYTYLFTDNSGCCALQHLTLNYWQQRYKKEFLFIVENLRLGRPVYAHCIWGADRTGQLAILLEGLLGVPYDGLIKDLELTSFSGNVRKKEDRDFVFDYFNTMRGSTLQEKINYYFVNRLRISQADIDYFRSEMLEDDGDNSTVGISDAERQINEEIMNNKRYDGLGRAVDGLLNKGIYIKNGKKILNNK